MGGGGRGRCLDTRACYLLINELGIREKERDPGKRERKIYSLKEEEGGGTCV